MRASPTKAVAAAAEKKRPIVTTAAPEIFEDEVSLEFRDGVALVSLCGLQGEFEWGTQRQEHRWNPVSVRALGKALDAVEAAGEAVNALVVTNEGKFWSNGMDLKYMDAHDPKAVKELGDRTNELMARILCFPLPTVAAINGHFCAAGGMMGLAFDYRVMSSDRGYFFIPGVDLGLVYSPFQMRLMETKLPKHLHRAVIIFNERKWTAPELAEGGPSCAIVDAAVPSERVLQTALEIAAGLKVKGQGAARKVLGKNKEGLYERVMQALKAGGEMGYGGRTKGVDRPSSAAMKSKL
eukprot:gnl/TRDRNA2_/TRDRNA2_82235_c0_seq1.p1 gnl/TRDRNA2_/TRDRNA2_82235_c0~~gnl/TRDRNA2_/TRDRNA2_82235_c0_seq1.p1  ORF type:complete len:344 (+),score=74.57 gnl/TRDRNA2_/TRDRNA2_82235_c0_seq1:150-1034(+)